VPVHEFLSADLELRRALESIRSRKIIFTNSDERHATRIITALGIRDLFERIFDIEAMRFIPKPNPEPYEMALAYLALRPAQCLLIDDMERNLEPARLIGMHTMLIGDGTPVNDEHHVIANIKELSEALKRIKRIDV
jgi:putative hydrolase of the HAD superfamily